MEQQTESEVLFGENPSRVQIKGLPYRTTTIKYPGWTGLLVFTSVVTILGSSTAVGYNLGVINTPGHIIKQFCNESIYIRFGKTLSNGQLDFLWSSILSIFLIGATIGSLTGTLVANTYGRRGSLNLASILGVIAGIFLWCSKIANSIEMLFIGRTIGGLSAGLITSIMPMYLMELAPPKLKGSTGALCPLGVTLGILLGQILSMHRILGNENNWPYCLAASIVPQALYILLFIVLPESPKYLYVIKNDHNLAIQQLKRIRGVNEEFLNDEINLLKFEEIENTVQGKGWSIVDVLKSDALLLPLLLVCSLQAGQQLSGVNAVFYYSSQIFEKAGLSTASSELATIGTGCCNIFMALISIQTMSSFKRRTILQISLVLSAVFLLILALSITYIEKYQWMPYLCITGVLGYVLCYGLGLGPIPYFIGAELFEIGPRPNAMSLGSMANWGGNFIIALLFPVMNTHIGAASFVIFAAIVISLLLFIRVYLPETKGKEPLEIYDLMTDGLRSRPLLNNYVVVNINV